eukprot:scaffold2447_cov110-Cylindrotheca_fusiformis.AAC.3
MTKTFCNRANSQQTVHCVQISFIFLPPHKTHDPGIAISLNIQHYTMSLPSSEYSNSSNNNMFDLSLMRERSQPLKTALFTNHNKDSSSPKSSTTTTATTTAADDSSISTFGSSTSEVVVAVPTASSNCSSSRRRSLFSTYWTKTGESPTVTIGCASRTQDSHSIQEHDDDDDDADNDSVSTQSSSSATAQPAAPSVPPRRSLFSQDAVIRYSKSLSQLSSHEEESALLPSTPRHKSESELRSNKKKHHHQKSCLREPRFSGSRRTGIVKRSSSIGSSASSSCSTVQFDMGSTEVRHYVQPSEVHAEEGWADLFY